MELVQMGTLCQLTAQSLTGDFGKPALVTAEKMIENDLAHILASDAHSSMWRKPVLSSAVNRAAKLLGSREQAMQMVSALPQAIIEDRDFAVEIPGLRKQHAPENIQQPKRRSFFGSMFFAVN